MSKHQKFRTRTVHRSQINPARYNPRQIDAHSRSKLKKNLARNGLVEPLVWNEGSSVLVGGHQRLSVLDELEGTLDYYLEVAVVDVDEKREKELNVALNSEGMQGSWDVDRLGEMIPELNLDAIGFDRLDIEMLFPDRDDLATLFSDDKEAPSVKADADEIKRMKAEKKRFKEQGAKQDDAGFYRTLVFASADEAACFDELVQSDAASDGAFADGRAVVNRLGADWDKAWGAWCKRKKEGESE